MSAFELLFALFGLLLGLAMAEVLSGFVQTIKVRRRVRVGWLTPLLGILVILDQTTMWMVAYDLRDVLPVTYLTLVIVLAMVGGYYILSTMIFPDDPGGCPDFDVHYYAHNRLVVSGVAAINLILISVTLTFARPAAMAVESVAARAEIAALEHGATGVGGIIAIVELLLLAALVAVESRKSNIAMLVALILLNLGAAVAVVT